MYAYILLAAVLGTALAAPTSPTTKSSSDQKLDQAPAAVLQKDPALLIAPLIPEASESAADPEWLKKSEATSSISSLEPAPAPALAPALLAPALLPATDPAATVGSLKAGVPSAKALSLIGPVIAAPPYLTTRQVSPYIFTGPALASAVELTAAPSSYSIEQHGYRITY